VQAVADAADRDATDLEDWLARPLGRLAKAGGSCAVAQDAVIAGNGAQGCEAPKGRSVRLVRLWAGIHFRSACNSGLALGRAVAAKVIEHAMNDGADP